MHKSYSIILLYLTSVILYGLYGFTMPIVMEILVSDQNIFILPSRDMTNIVSYVNLNSGFIFALSPTYFLFGPIIGTIASFDNIKKYILYGLTCFIVTYSLFYFSIKNQLTLLLLTSSLLLTLGLLTAPIITTAITQSISGMKRARFFSFNTLNIASMIVCGQLSCYLILDPSLFRFNHEFPIMIAIICFILLFMIIYIALPNPSQKNQRMQPVTPIYLYQAVQRLFMRKGSCLSILGLWLFQFVMGLIYIYVPLYLRNNFQYQALQIGDFIYYIGGYMLLGIILYHLLLKRISLPKLFFISLCLLLIGLSICITEFNIVCIEIGIIPISLGIAIGLTTIWVLLAASIKPCYRGFTLCLAWSGCALTWMSSGMLANYLSSLHDQLPFYVALLLIALCIVGYLTFVNGKPYKNLLTKLTVNSP